MPEPKILISINIQVQYTLSVLYLDSCLSLRSPHGKVERVHTSCDSDIDCVQSHLHFILWAGSLDASSGASRRAGRKFGGSWRSGSRGWALPPPPSRSDLLRPPGMNKQDGERRIWMIILLEYPASTRGSNLWGSRTFDRFPVLADALEDAGYTDTDLLEHLRSPSSHVRGCWAMDLVLE